MTAADKAFAGSIPEIYQRYLVPLIFEPYAQDVAERVRKMEPRDLLETAAGTGVVTRAITSVLPGLARLVATDLNKAMLDLARPSFSRDTRIEWEIADALALPFEDQSFDVVVCQFGVMFFPDKLKGFSEAHRVLRPSGRFLFSVWGGIDENDFAAIVTEALGQIFPEDPPRFLARTPHGYCDANEIRRVLAAGGFSDVTIEIVEHVSRCASPRDPAVGYCEGTPLRNEIVARDPSRLEEATQHAAEALGRRFGAGPIEGRTQALLCTANR